MNSKLRYYFLCMCCLFIPFAQAQEKELSGTVTEGGMPLPGVTVLIQGTQQGVQTDLDGKYMLKVKQADVLVFSFIGMKEVKYTVTKASVFNVEMTAEENMLEAIVVTALGIKRDKKKLGVFFSRSERRNFS